MDHCVISSIVYQTYTHGLDIINVMYITFVFVFGVLILRRVIKSLFLFLFLELCLSCLRTSVI